MEQKINVHVRDLSPEELEKISSGIKHYAVEKNIPLSEEIPIHAVVYDRDTFIGGAIGRIYDDWLYISDVWVLESRRNMGIGRQLVLSLESQAVGKGITKSMLWTASFEAPEFYEKLGYQRCLTLEDKPKGHSRIALRKNLRG